MMSEISVTRYSCQGCGAQRFGFLIDKTPDEKPEVYLYCRKCERRICITDGLFHEPERQIPTDRARVISSLACGSCNARTWTVTVETGRYDTFREVYLICARCKLRMDITSGVWIDGEEKYYWAEMAESQERAYQREQRKQARYAKQREHDEIDDRENS